MNEKKASSGILYVIGTGPGSADDRTRRAETAISASDTIIGYRMYLDYISDLTAGKKIIASGIRSEI